MNVRFQNSPVDEQRHEDERDGDAADVVLVVGDHLGIGVVGVLRDGGGVEQDVGDVEQRGRCPGRELDAMRSEKKTQRTRRKRKQPKSKARKEAADRNNRRRRKRRLLQGPYDATREC